MGQRLFGVWRNPENFPGRQFQCGHCGVVVASDRGYIASPPVGAGIMTYVVICPNCNRPSYLEGGSQIPGVPFGTPVEKTPDNVRELYDEARRCTAAQAHTSAVLAARKLLMHIAVDKGAPPGQNFVSYVEYLADKGYVPPNGKGWVDHIRTKGNEANHEIKLMSKADAEDLITFTEMLLKFIYELPAKVPRRAKP